jgi:hypothetical protein
MTTMNRSEIKKLIGWAAANFPHLQDKDLSPTAELWFKLLPDMPYDIAEKALIKVLATAKFFPTVAEIRAAASDLCAPRVLSSGEAWEQVRKAIRRYGYYAQKETMELLDPVTAKAVECVGLTEICYSEEPDIIRAHFMKIYDQLANREREQALLPPQIRRVIDDVASLKVLPGGRN